MLLISWQRKIVFCEILLTAAQLCGPADMARPCYLHVSGRFKRRQVVLILLDISNLQGYICGPNSWQQAYLVDVRAPFILKGATFTAWQ